jgi:transcriptional regulator with XRE-family HTH domain
MGQLHHKYYRRPSGQFNSQIGENLRKARESKNITQGHAARFTGVRDQSAISRMEAGQTKVTAEQLLTFSQLYGKPVSYFFRGLL